MTSSTLEPHQQRVVDEKADLDEKLRKLMAFFNSNIFAGLSENEQSLMKAQAMAMSMYSFALAERIAAFAS